MAKDVKTIDKRLKNLKTGIGKKFTSDNQPTPEAKKEGWKEYRAKRMLTQTIIAEISKGDNLKEYINSLILNAKMGNAKAIETINNGIEEQKTIQEIILPKIGKDLAEDYI